MRLEVINFEKFNPRTDRKKHSWFRLENDFINDEKLFKLSPIEKFVWVCILAYRSNKCDQIFDLDLEYLADQLDVKEDIISSTIQKLSKSKAMIIHEVVTTGNQLVSTGSPTYERTNEQTNGRKAATDADEISNELKDQWIRTYKDEKWIDFEISAANAWILANPLKAPKSDFKRFYNGWLKRGWEKHRISMPSNRALVPFKTNYGPVGVPPELNKPHPGGKPLSPDLKEALNIALRRTPAKPKDEPPPGAA